MHSWNFNKWLAAVGLRRPEAPALIPGVQPVVIAGDHSVFASQILPAVLYAGGQRTAIAGEYSVMKVTCRAEGGLWIRRARWNTGTNSNHNWHVLAGAGTTLANTLTLTQMNVGGSDALSTVELGSTNGGAAPAVGTDVPFENINTQMKLEIADLYVPPGYTFETWPVHVARALCGWIMLEECPAGKLE